MQHDSLLCSFCVVGESKSLLSLTKGDKWLGTVPFESSALWSKSETLVLSFANTRKEEKKQTTTQEIL